MANSQLSRPGQARLEIHGRPGQVWGSLVMPTSGKATMRIVGDTLHTSTENSYGLEKKETQTRIQNIDAVEVVEGRLWWLLCLGLSTLVWGIGIVFIVLFFVLKQNWMVVHTPCSPLILFYKKADNVQAFAPTYSTFRASSMLLLCPGNNPLLKPLDQPIHDLPLLQVEL
jgi:hypothetical protein